MEMEPITPKIMLNKINASFIKRSFNTSYCEKIINLFKEHIPSLDSHFFTVVHGDVNSNNWLLCNRDELFLVDWEGA